MILTLTHVIVCNGNFLGLIVALMSTDGTNEPGCLPRAFPGPVLFEVVLAGFDVATGDENHETDETVEHSIDKNTTKL